jgi:hypothetical protein
MKIFIWEHVQQRRIRRAVDLPRYAVHSQLELARHRRPSAGLKIQVCAKRLPSGRENFVNFSDRNAFRKLTGGMTSEGQCQAVPHTVDDFQLVNAPLFRTKEIESIQESLAAKGMNAALCPSRWLCSAAPLGCGGWRVKAKFDRVLNARGDRRNQSTAPAEFVRRRCHVRFRTRTMKVVGRSLFVSAAGLFERHNGLLLFSSDRRDFYASSARSSVSVSRIWKLSSYSMGAPAPGSAAFSVFLCARRSAFMRCFSWRFISF